MKNNQFKTYKVDSIYHHQETGVQFFFTRLESRNPFNKVKLNLIVAGVVNPVVNLTFNHDNNNMISITCQYFDEIIKNYFHGQRQVVVQHTPPVVKVEKKNPIDVVRYIRPVSLYDNLYGVTLVFTLDYTNRNIDVGISICWGDNFTKVEGIDRARSGKISITGMTMPDDIHNGTCDMGLVQWFVERSPTEQHDNAVYNIRQSAISKIISIYTASLR